MHKSDRVASIRRIYGSIIEMKERFYSIMASHPSFVRDNKNSHPGEHFNDLIASLYDVANKIEDPEH